MVAVFAEERNLVGTVRIGVSARTDPGPLDLSSQFPILSELAESALSSVHGNITWRTKPAKSVIVGKGDPSHEVYLLASGIARVVSFSRTGRIIDFAELGDGAIFGELSAIDRQPRSATVICRTDCRIGVLRATDFMRLALSEATFTRALLEHFAATVRAADQRIETLGLLSAESRLCIKLLSELIPNPGDLSTYVVNPMPSQMDLASAIGVTRQTVVRVMGKLTSSGIIERRGRVLHVRDHESLRTLALGKTRQE